MVWQSMHRYELEVFPLLEETYDLISLEGKTNLQPVEIMRALQWLENKKLITIKKQPKHVIVLGKNGKKYQHEKLPEVRLLEHITDEGPYTLEQLQKKAMLAPEEMGIVLGIGKKLGLLSMDKGNITLNLNQASVVKKQSGQHILDVLTQEKPLDVFNEFDQHLIKELQKRKDILSIIERKDVSIALTKEGIALLKKKPDLSKLKNQEEKLTASMLKDGSWQTKTFRPYDVSINVPRTSGGRRHFVNQAIDYIRRIWTEMGFVEMEGSFVQTAFSDLDMLYVPQDHPARTMQDTYYVDYKKQGDIPPMLAKKVKAVHENGADTGSMGWRYAWSEDEARQLLLRTHTTVLSAQTIASKDVSIPGKYFAIGRNFRNETLDWKHLFEFFQVEGIVIGQDVNLAQLKGYLREFYRKMGYVDVRMRPGHFPYTEPSMEVDVLHKNGKWIELGGSGIFRPEVTKTLLGKEIPVLAWGQGMERIISSYFGITDIRDLYKNDLKQMKTMKVFKE